jgi:hypothetical protein
MNVSHFGTFISRTIIVIAIAITPSLNASRQFLCILSLIKNYSFHFTTLESRITAQVSKLARIRRGIAFLTSHPKLNPRITSPNSTNILENIVISRKRGLLRIRQTTKAKTHPKTRTPALQNPNWVE